MLALTFSTLALWLLGCLAIAWRTREWGSDPKARGLGCFIVAGMLFYWTLLVVAVAVAVVGAVILWVR